MAIALVMSAVAQVSDYSPTITTSGVTTTGATLLVSGANWLDAYTGGVEANATVTDSKGNTWHPLTEKRQPGDGVLSVVQFFYAWNPTVGAAHTFTITMSHATTFPTITMHAFSGIAVDSDPYVDENGFVFAGVPVLTIAPGAVRGTELVVSAIAHVGDQDFTIDSSFTIANQGPLIPGAGTGYAVAYLANGTWGSLNPTWTNPVVGRRAAVIAAFGVPTATPGVSCEGGGEMGLLPDLTVSEDWAL